MEICPQDLGEQAKLSYRDRSQIHAWLGGERSRNRLERNMGKLWGDENTLHHDEGDGWPGMYVCQNSLNGTTKNRCT